MDPMMDFFLILTLFYIIDIFRIFMWYIPICSTCNVGNNRIKNLNVNDEKE